MNQEKKKPKAARNFEDAADLIKTVIQTVSELIPLFLEKWSIIKDKPIWSEIQEDHKKIKRRLINVIKRQRLYQMFFFMLLVWNTILTVIIILKMQ